MDAKVKKSLLDLCMLSVLNKGDSYGWQIVKDISGVLEVTESTLYPALSRLEREGYLTTYTEPHGGRLRRYFKITKAGEKHLYRFEDDYDELERIHRFILNSIEEVRQ